MHHLKSLIRPPPELGLLALQQFFAAFSQGSPYKSSSVLFIGFPKLCLLASLSAFYRLSQVLFVWVFLSSFQRFFPNLFIGFPKLFPQAFICSFANIIRTFPFLYLSWKSTLQMRPLRQLASHSEVARFIHFFIIYFYRKKPL